MKMMNEAEYRWKAFKMTWLVPNWERSRGPAFWLWRLMDWWRYNSDPDNCCSLRHKISEWAHDDLVRWLTPWLAPARKLMNFCIQENGTKLLWYDALHFRVRTRDESQWYFDGELSLSGKMKVWKTQWLGEDGKPVNLFIWGIGGLCGKDAPEPVERRELAWSGGVLSAKQLATVAEDLMRSVPEIGWLQGSARAVVMAWKLGLDESKTRDALQDAAVKRVNPDAQHLWELSEEEWDAVDKIMVEFSAEEARRIVDEAKQA